MQVVLTSETRMQKEKHVIVINLFGGPGIGKSTQASYLFYRLKEMQLNVELVSEYAKELTWENNLDKLSDQLYVTAKQNRRLSRLAGKVDVVVTDSPLLLGIHYATPNFIGGTFEPMVHGLFSAYDNFNVLLTRCKPYKTEGRFQSEDEARTIDGAILTMLDSGGYQYMEVQGSPSGMDEVLVRLRDVLTEKNLT